MATLVGAALAGVAVRRQEPNRVGPVFRDHQDLNGTQIGHGEGMDRLNDLRAEGAADPVGLEKPLDDEGFGLVPGPVNFREPTWRIRGLAS